jgi:tetratricopeptide (TPR) repeat protein
MDTRLLVAILTGVAVFFGLLALFPGKADDEPGLGEAIRAWRARRVAGAAELIAKARLELAPRTLIAITIAGPLVFGAVGLLLSPLVALVGVGIGLLLPRAYLDYRVRAEARAADEDAPRILRAMVNRAAAGGTYPDLFTAAAEAARHRWVRSDFDEATARYYAAEPPPEAGALIAALGTALVWGTGLDLNPALFVLVLYLLTMRVRILVDLGNVLARRSNYALAEHSYALAERAWPDETGKLLVKMNRGVMAVHQADSERAVAVLREVLSAADGGFLGAKSTAACHYNLGVAYLRQGQDARVWLEFNKVLDDWPMTEYARYARIALERRKRGTAAGQAQAGRTPGDQPPGHEE